MRRQTMTADGPCAPTVASTPSLVTGHKGKKPITTDFLDFSRPDSRERACARGVELNCQLAPDSYVGVVQLSYPSG